MDLDDDDLPKPLERNAKRRKPQVSFDAEGCAEGWAYVVRKAFRPAMDIVFSERVRTEKAPDGAKVKRRFQEWTEGDPPMYAFRETDALTSREVIRGSLNRFIAQITQAAPDALDGRAIKPGSVGFRFFEWIDGEPGSYVEQGFYICTQAAFVEFLRSGVLPTNAKQ